MYHELELRKRLRSD